MYRLARHAAVGDHDRLRLQHGAHLQRQRAADAVQRERRGAQFLQTLNARQMSDSTFFNCDDDRWKSRSATTAVAPSAISSSFVRCSWPASSRSRMMFSVRRLNFLFEVITQNITNAHFFASWITSLPTADVAPFCTIRSPCCIVPKSASMR